MRKNEQSRILTGLGRSIVINYFHDGRKRNLDDLAVRPFNFECRRREGLSCLHAPHNAPHAMTVVGDDFDIPWPYNGWSADRALVISIPPSIFTGILHDYTWLGLHS